MRYSIIHHDVRQKFDLSLHEYVVCDAIYQLSYHYGVTKSNSEMAEFLGVDRANISRIKERLLAKGLVTNAGDAWGSTELWTNAVTSSSVQNQQERAPSTPTRAPSTQNVLPAHHSISKEYKELYIATEVAEEKPPKEKKDTTYVRVFELWGKYPLNWKVNRTEIQAAKNLLEEHGLEDCKDALDFYKKHKKEEMCPQILKPSDLDRKYANLLAYFEKV